MLEKVYNDNIASGMEEKDAMKNMKSSERDIKELLAKNGMLK